MKDYALLVVAVLCGLVALVSLCICILCAVNEATGHYEGIEERDDRMPAEDMKRLARVVMIVSGLIFCVTIYSAWRIRVYLVATHLEVLTTFSMWYMVGYASRFIVLIKRHQVLSPVFAVEWEAVLGALFYALGGPLTTLHMLKVLLFEKDFWKP